MSSQLLLAFKAYGGFILLLFVSVAATYGWNRFQISRLRGDQALVDDIAAAQATGATIPDSLTANLPTLNELAVSVLRQRIISRGLVNLIQFLAAVMFGAAILIVLAFLYFSTFGSADRYFKSAEGIYLIDDSRATRVHIYPENARKNESVHVEVVISGTRDIHVSDFSAYPPTEAPPTSCPAATKGLAVALRAPAFDPPDHRSLTRFIRAVYANPKYCEVAYEWILLPKYGGNQVVAVQYSQKQAKVLRPFHTGYFAIAVSEGTSIDALIPLLVAVVSLVGAILTTILGTMLARRQDGTEKTAAPGGAGATP